MSGRRTCPGCGNSYHVMYKQPKVADVCDGCGSALVIRDDDKPETVLERLRVYHEQTAPLSDFYAKLSRNGCEIYQKKVGASFPLGTMLRICDKNGFYAIGEVIEYPDGAAIKLRKRFDITK
jgi:hypothetical protein